jgi:hypothetical protein
MGWPSPCAHRTQCECHHHGAGKKTTLGVGWAGRTTQDGPLLGWESWDHLEASFGRELRNSGGLRAQGGEGPGCAYTTWERTAIPMAMGTRCSRSTTLCRLGCFPFPKVSIQEHSPTAQKKDLCPFILSYLPKTCYTLLTRKQNKNEATSPNPDVPSQVPSTVQC